MVGVHRDVLHAGGHTKFSPDWCFGLLKQCYRRTFVSSLQDIVDVANTSPDVNTAQLVGTQDGEVLVPTYDWAMSLGEYFRRISAMKSYHHFSLSAPLLGSVTPPSATISGFPLVSNYHQKFHHPVSPKNGSGTFTMTSLNSVGEDLVCPLPSTPLQEQGSEEGGDALEETAPPPTKCPKKCRICGTPATERRVVMAEWRVVMAESDSYISPPPPF